MVAIILLNSLRAARPEDKLWPTQFAFRRKRGTGDALFIARRVLEEAWARKNGKAILLALDWAKAFDSISPQAWSQALKRFGCPPEFVRMIAAMYSERKFVVSDNGQTSAKHAQEFGISQGFPLSLFLFVMVMTVSPKQS